MNTDLFQLLIVDDEPGIRLLLEHYMKGKFAVTALATGEEALQWIEANGPAACIIMDLKLPKMSGLDVIRSLRADHRYDKVPIIVLSSKESSADRIECLRAGADDYLVKPFNPEELEVRIQSILRRIR